MFSFEREYFNDIKHLLRAAENDIVFTQQSVTYEVLQHSILGPILFNVHVNDTSNNVNNCVLFQYANDTLYLQTNDINNKMLSLKQINCYKSSSVFS